SATFVAISSTAPYSVSSDFGQLHVIRHLSSGIDCAIAGLAMAVAARPMPAACRSLRRFIFCTLPLSALRDEPASLRDGTGRHRAVGRASVMARLPRFRLTCAGCEDPAPKYQEPVS